MGGGRGLVAPRADATWPEAVAPGAGPGAGSAKPATHSRVGEGDDAGPFKVGQRVVVAGLETAAGQRLNGERGVLQQWHADKARWQLRLEGEEERHLLLRPACLRPG